MGGLNSLGGLNNVNVDFRPTVELTAPKKDKGDGIAPTELKTKIPDDNERTKVQGEIAQKLNKLMWLDLITGQGDRHWDNYFVCIEKNVTTNTFDVTVKAVVLQARLLAQDVQLKLATNRSWREHGKRERHKR